MVFQLLRGRTQTRARTPTKTRGCFAESLACRVKLRRGGLPISTRVSIIPFLLLASFPHFPTMSPFFFLVAKRGLGKAPVANTFYAITTWIYAFQWTHLCDGSKKNTRLLHDESRSKLVIKFHRGKQRQKSSLSEKYAPSDGNWFRRAIIESHWVSGLTIQNASATRIMVANW